MITNIIIPKKSNKYDIKKLISYDDYITLYHGLVKLGKKKVIIKTIEITNLSSICNDLINNVKKILNLHHKNIISPYGHFKDNTYIYIIMPYCKYSYHDIFYNLYNKNNIILNKTCIIATIVKQLLIGLQYLHSKGIIHGDIRGNNIMISKCGNIKLINFDKSEKIISNNIKKKIETYNGTIQWISPEILLGDPYTIFSDIWALGITCLEMWFGHPPYEHFPIMKITINIIDKNPPSHKSYNKHKKNKSIPKEFKNFIKKCLVKIPIKRSSIDNLLNTNFIKKYAKDEKYIKNNLKIIHTNNNIETKSYYDTI